MRVINWKFIFNNKGFVDVIVGAIIGAGLAESVNAMTSSKAKSPSSTAPTTPTTADASTAASNTVASNRQAALLSGGNTDLTGGMGVLTGSDVSKTGLIGG
jgi:hypothetical protein